MKKYIVMIACLLGLTSCPSMPDSLDPTEVVTYSQLQRAIEDAQVAVDEAEAFASAHPEDQTAAARLMEAKGTYEQAELAMAEFEQQILKSRYGGFLSFFGQTPVVGPWVTLLAPLILPLFGRRGRKHYLKAVKMVNPLSPEGGKPVAPIQAVTSVVKAMGILHSSPESEKAAVSTA